MNVAVTIEREIEKDQEMTIEDLVGKCSKCEGAGSVEHPDMQKKRQGFGTNLIAATPVTCDQCKGTGVILTDDGKVLKQFIDVLQSKGMLRRI